MALVKPKTALEVAEIIWPEFKIENGGIYLGWMDASDPNNTFRDLVDSESFVNHLHVLDYFRHEADLDCEPWWNSEHPDFIAACDLGQTLVQTWSSKLFRDFPDDEFLVYYAQYDNPIVRFHKVRTGIPNWLDPLQFSAEIDRNEIVIRSTKNGKA